MSKTFVIVKKVRLPFGGFTLVELLISMFLLLAVISVVMTIFVAGLRGSSRSSAEIDIQRNGDFAVSQITRMIRNSKSFDGVSVDGNTYTTSCFDSSGVTPTPTPVLYKYVKVSSFDGGQTIIACPDVGETAITSQSAILGTPASLTDSSSVTVQPISCYFTCQQDSATDVPSISFGFTLESVKDNGVAGQITGQTFESTVVPRNSFR